MKLLRFDIEHYRSCLRTSLLPNSQLTALIGINGSGKSNILHGIRLFRRFTSQRFGPGVDASPYVNKSSILVDLETNGKRVAVKGLVAYETNERNVDMIVGTDLKWNLQDITGKKSWIHIPIEMLVYGRPWGIVVPSGRRLTYKDMEQGG